MMTNLVTILVVVCLTNGERLQATIARLGNADSGLINGFVFVENNTNATNTQAFLLSFTLSGLEPGTNLTLAIHEGARCTYKGVGPPLTAAAAWQQGEAPTITSSATIDVGGPLSALLHHAAVLSTESKHLACGILRAQDNAQRPLQHRPKPGDTLPYNSSYGVVIVILVIVVLVGIITICVRWRIHVKAERKRMQKREMESLEQLAAMPEGSPSARTVPRITAAETAGQGSAEASRARIAEEIESEVVELRTTIEQTAPIGSAPKLLSLEEMNVWRRKVQKQMGRANATTTNDSLAMRPVSDGDYTEEEDLKLEEEGSAGNAHRVHFYSRSRSLEGAGDNGADDAALLHTQASSDAHTPGASVLPPSRSRESESPQKNLLSYELEFSNSKSISL